MAILTEAAKKLGDEPVYPESLAVTPCGDLESGASYEGLGLTKREHFTAMAMQGLSSNSNLNLLSPALKAALSIDAAHALLNELVK